MSIVDITTEKDFNDAIAQNDTVCVKFSASWCGACRQQLPRVVALAGKHANVKFIAVDADDLSDVAEAHGVSSLPTYVVYKKQQRVKTVASDLAAVEAAF